MGYSAFYRAKVRLLAVLSTAIAAAVLFVNAAGAHEVLPAISDMEREGETLRFTVAATLESFIAEVNLEGLEDTNAAGNVAAFDELRALAPDALAQRFEAFWPVMADKITVRVGDVDLPLRLTGVEVPEVPDLELARQSIFRFEADLPEGAEEVVVGWTADLGALVLRQQGVSDAYDGYLDGGALTPPIALGGGTTDGGWQAYSAAVPAGVTLIVPLGLEHAVFVLALFVATTRLVPLFLQIKAFALGHVVTLVPALMGYVAVPGSVIAPLVAASVVLVAVDNLFRSGSVPLWRLAAVLALGLVHGLAMAAAAAGLGLDQATTIPELIGLIVGIELGLLMVLAVAFLITFAAERSSRAGASEPLPAVFMLGCALVLVPALAAVLLGQGGTLAESQLPFLAAAAILLGLSATAVLAEGQGTYAKMVAQPASVLIALSGVWWLVQQFLI